MLSPYFESHHNTALHQATTIYTSLPYSYWHFTSTRFLLTFHFLGRTPFQFLPLHFPTLHCSTHNTVILSPTLFACKLTLLPLHFPTLHCGTHNTVILSPTLFACKLTHFPLSLHCTFHHLSSPNSLHTSLY